MSNLTYTRILSENDADVLQLMKIYKKLEVARFISISDDYFHYVTGTENVYFYKVYENGRLIGSIHLEKNEKLLYMDILVFPELQKTGLGTRIIKDIQSDIFGLGYESIEISIDESNTASLKLFEKVGFTFVSKDDELLNFVYRRR